MVWAVLVMGAVSSDRLLAEDWPQFRGPQGRAVTADKAPLNWSNDAGIRWQIKLPGLGVSSPIVVGDSVFVTSYSGYGPEGGEMEDLKRHLSCFDRATGKERWTKTVAAKLPEDPYSPPGVTAHGYASHTPVSDGKFVYAFFGKSGVYAYDMDGNEQWQAEVGQGSGPMQWGSASSLIVHDGRVIVTASEESEAIYALEAQTGKTLWKSPAEGLRNTWGTPAIVKTEQGDELVLSVPGEVWGFNAETGKLRWYARGTSDNSASASLAIDNDVVFAMGGRGGEAVAIKTGGKGDVNDRGVLWDAQAQGRFASPVAFQGYVYNVNGDVVSCYDAKTGEQVYQERLPEASGADASQESGGRGRGGRGGGGQYGSPIIADGKLYVPMKSGVVYVLEAKPEFKVLATNVISGDRSGFDATPAVSQGNLFLRSGNTLYCIGAS